MGYYSRNQLKSLTVGASPEEASEGVDHAESIDQAMG